MSRNPKSIAREFTFCFLYSLENNNFDAQDLDQSITEFEASTLKEDSEFKLDPPNVASQSYAKTLISGYMDKKDELIEQVTPHLKNHNFGKLQKIDRTIVLLGAYELSFQKDTPPKVVVSESLALAHKYGGDGTRSFVNAVLDKML